MQMTNQRAQATEPEDVTRLIVERVNAQDAAGVADLYAPDAILAFPPGRTTVGREAILTLYEQLMAKNPQFQMEKPMPTLRHGDIALASTLSADNTGVRVQVLRRQPDGTWLRIIDRPEATIETTA